MIVIFRLFLNLFADFFLVNNILQLNHPTDSTLNLAELQIEYFVSFLLCFTWLIIWILAIKEAPKAELFVDKPKFLFECYLSYSLINWTGSYIFGLECGSSVLFKLQSFLFIYFPILILLIIHLRLKQAFFVIIFASILP